MRDLSRARLAKAARLTRDEGISNVGRSLSVGLGLCDVYFSVHSFMPSIHPSEAMCVSGKKKSPVDDGAVEVRVFRFPLILRCETLFLLVHDAYGTVRYSISTSGINLANEREKSE